MSKTAFDPGHYANANIGPGSYREGNVMLQFGLALQKAYDVFLTRTDGVNLDLKARAVKAKAAGCDTLISLHTNAPAAAKGIVIYHSVRYPEDKALAEQLGTELSKATGIPFKGAKTRSFEKDKNTDYYGIIRESVKLGIHAFIVEHGSHWEFAVDTDKKIVACFERFFILCFSRL
jgi:N-acetylmuramoyl-L-alanine amidase